MFGLTMAVLVIAQILYPLLPLYAVGYMLGSCVLHAFVIEGERDEYRLKLEELLARERAQRLELDSVRSMAYTDSLTRVKSKHAYIEDEMQIDRQITGGEDVSFAVAAFDLNGLKHVNDTLGHEMGDRYIISACRLICNHFKHSPVYRMGGDEFVAILRNSDFDERAALIADFERVIDENLSKGEVVVSSGLAVFDPKRDNSCRDVFERADALMYERKRKLKEMGARERD